MIINQTERAIVECVRERTKEELSKRIPCIDAIDYRRLTYLLIEDRMAMYEEAKVDETIPIILAEFGVHSPNTYYNWYEKWHKVYQSM